MFSNRAAFAILAVACIAAAGGGAYLATRQNADVSMAATDAEFDALTRSDAKPVQETEAVIGDSPRVKPAAPPVETAAPAATVTRKRETAPGRPAPKPARAPESATARNNQLPTLDRSWPSSSTPSPQAPAPSSAPTVESPAPVAPVEERVQEPPKAAEPPAPTFEEL